MDFKNGNGPRPKPLRVLQFIESGGPGGAERVVASLADALRRSGTDVQVLTFRSGWLTEAIDALGITRHQVKTQRRLDIRLPLRIAQILRRERIDLLHSHLLDSNFYGSIAARLAGVPHLATEHGDVHHIDKKKLLRAKLFTISCMGSCFCAVARHTASRLEELGVPARRTRCLKNPLAFTPPQNVERERVRAELGASSTDWLWINVANLRAVKNQLLLLKALRFSLDLSNRPQRLLFVGDGPERENLARLAAELRLPEAVSFLGFRNDVARLMQASDGFVLSSFSEAMPMSVMEAVASGLPLICTSVGGLPEIAAEGIARLVPSGDAEAFGEAMAHTVSDGTSLQRAAAEKARHFLARYGAESVAADYLNCYRELLGKLRR